MKIRGRIVLFAYPLIELLLLWWVASITGRAIAMLLIIAGFPIGAALIRNAAAKASVIVTTADENKPQVARSSALMCGSGVLIMIPGFATDLIGLILLIPPIGNRVVRALGSWIGLRMIRMPGFGSAGFTGSEFASYVDGEVIRGMVIDEETFVQPENGGPEGPPSIQS
ncbi:MAG: FxsA family protein [Actinomycetales bacterium]|nr:FxsA family protein [Actinomycetales bacterium]